MEILGIVAVGIVVLLILFFTISAIFGSKGFNKATIVSGSYPGSKQFTETTTIPESYNQAEGRVYSYTGWLLVKDFTTGYGTRRRILSRGD